MRLSRDKGGGRMVRGRRGRGRRRGSCFKMGRIAEGFMWAPGEVVASFRGRFRGRLLSKLLKAMVWLNSLRKATSCVPDSSSLEKGRFGWTGNHGCIDINS